ncbi:MAG: periplasmic heavy metal sensor [Elusimicrobia bacterium]|nr:periplasmic heavy metal sensor [Elusimicrobiota bacterium]
MKRRITVFLCGLLLIGIGSVSAFGGKTKKEQDTGMHEKGKHWENVMEDLKLTDEQRGRISDQRHENMKKRIEVKASLDLKQLDLKHELSKAKPDRAAVDRLVDEISAVQKEMLKNRVDSILGFRDILTQEQWEKVKDRKLTGFGEEGRAPSDRHGKDEYKRKK